MLFFTFDVGKNGGEGKILKLGNMPSVCLLFLRHVSSRVLISFLLRKKCNFAVSRLTRKKTLVLEDNGLFIKPSAHSTIIVAKDQDFCRWRRKLALCRNKHQ